MSAELPMRLAILERIALTENMQNRMKYADGMLSMEELENKNMEQSLRLTAYRAAAQKGCLQEFLHTPRRNK